MKKLAIAAPLVTALLLLAGNVASPLEAATSSTRTTTERYYLSQTWHAVSRVARNGRPTDIYALQDEVTTTNGAHAGVVDGYAINLRPPMVAWSATATLGTGTLVFSGAYPLSGGERRLVIVGGTGAYDGVRGFATLTDAGSRGDLATLTLER
jgi:hypothetical protein